MRVAVARLKRFEIPASYVGIWRYLNNAYNEDAFQKSCPPDQERFISSIYLEEQLRFESYANHFHL